MTKNFCVYLYGDGRAEAYEKPKTYYREGFWHNHNGACEIHQVYIIANTATEAINRAKIMLSKFFEEGKANATIHNI